MKKKLVINTISSLSYQIIAIICGFILPRLILSVYNSEVNGLVNSITEFLKIISILDFGVGTVVCSALYKPLAYKDNAEINRVLSSAKRYFTKIAYILCVYIAILPFIFFFFINNNFDFIFTAALILAMSISSFAQYYFGIVNQLLLNADQKGYVQYNLQSFTLILNTILCTLLIKIGASIQIVKITTSLVFLMRPLYLSWYVKKNYNIDSKVKYDNEPIKQKWNGLYQHFAAIVLDVTDTIILSIFSTLSNVSIYSVYFLVIHGIRQIIQSVTNGVQSFLGNLIARGKKEKLDFAFEWTEWSIHTFTTFAFGCCLVLIVPFVQIYTSGVNDANYAVPLFGYLLSLAHASYCYRLPYHLVVKASGMFKETQNNYLIAMLLNLIISMVTVRLYGLIGVAIGTLIAMLYQTIWMAWFCYKNVFGRSFNKFLKQMLVDILTLCIGFIVANFFNITAVNICGFIIDSIKIALIWFVIIILVNIIFYKEKLSLVRIKNHFRSR